MGDALAAIVALGNYQQADEEGIMVLVSRQAIHEVLDHIEVKEARIAELEGVLSPFADIADECDEWAMDDGNQAPIDAGQCRAARAALQGGKE